MTFWNSAGVSAFLRLPFRKLFAEVGGGNLEVGASLRERDQPKEPASAFEDMLAALRRQRQDRLVTVRDAAAALARIQARLEDLQKKDTVPGPSV